MINLTPLLSSLVLHILIKSVDNGQWKKHSAEMSVGGVGRVKRGSMEEGMEAVSGGADHESGFGSSAKQPLIHS